MSRSICAGVAELLPGAEISVSSWSLSQMKRRSWRKQFFAHATAQRVVALFLEVGMIHNRRDRTGPVQSLLLLAPTPIGSVGRKA